MSSGLGSALRFTIRLGAELAITAGVVLAAFVFYLLVWTNHQTAQAQDDLLDDFHAQKEHVEKDGGGKDENEGEAHGRTSGVVALSISAAPTRN